MRAAALLGLVSDSGRAWGRSGVMGSHMAMSVSIPEPSGDIADSPQTAKVSCSWHSGLADRK